MSSFKPLAFSENITIDQMDVADFSNVNGYRVPMRQLQFSGNSKYWQQYGASNSKWEAKHPDW